MSTCEGVLDVTYRSLPHIKPSPGTHRERESEAAQETPGAVTWMSKQRGWVTPGDNLTGWPRIGMPGELLQSACTPVGAKGNDDDDGVSGSDGVRHAQSIHPFQLPAVVSSCPGQTSRMTDKRHSVWSGV